MRFNWIQRIWVCLFKNVGIYTSCFYYWVRFISGSNVVIIKKGRRICGKGGALCNFPIVQNKAYFEGKIQQSGLWGIGLATSNVDLNMTPLGTDNQSWILRHDGKVVHNNNVLFEVRKPVQEGDIIGVTFDHVQLKFFINNEPIDFEVSNIKGSEGGIYPVVYVDSGAIIDMVFAQPCFTYNPPASSGFGAILIEKALL